jgi:predicted small secreted protein
MKTIISFILALFVLALAGCATFRGMAEDFENLGRGIKKTVSEEENK